MHDKHEQYMQECIALAKIAHKNGESPVGAILVHQDKIIGRGIEAGKETRDITNHAEILAVRDAIQKSNSSLLHEATLYTTHEPCIMCSYVIRHHKIPRIVFGLTVEYIGGASSELNILTTETVPKWGTKPEVIEGVCKQACLSVEKG